MVGTISDDLSAITVATDNVARGFRGVPQRACNLVHFSGYPPK
jgi:hypothetical protein